MLNVDMLLALRYYKNHHPRYIIDTHRPQNVKFRLSLLTYHAKYIKNVSNILYSLKWLLRTFKWTMKFEHSLHAGPDIRRQSSSSI